MSGAGDTAAEFSLLDFRLLRVAFWLGVCPQLLQNWNVRAQKLGGVLVPKRDGNFCGGTVSEQDSAA